MVVDQVLPVSVCKVVTAAHPFSRHLLVLAAAAAAPLLVLLVYKPEVQVAAAVAVAQPLDSVQRGLAYQDLLVE